ncbi:hypothetical protein JCM10212_002269 [Sporobolomyces blumeae]
MPLDVFERIFRHALDEDPDCLTKLLVVSKRFPPIVAALVRKEKHKTMTLTVESIGELVEAAKEYAPARGRANETSRNNVNLDKLVLRRVLNPSFESVSSQEISYDKYTTALSTILSSSSTSGLTTLSLALASTNAPRSLKDLLGKNMSGILSALNLEHFHLEGVEIWFHDLTTRAIVAEPLDASALGHSTIAWNALEEVVKRASERGNRAGFAEVQVWDRFADGKDVKKENKGESETATANKGKGEDEVERRESDPDEAGQDGTRRDALDEGTRSPLERILASMGGSVASLDTFLLTTSYLRSSPDPVSLARLVPFLSNVRKLVIEDSNASGLRTHVMQAVEEGELKALAELVSLFRKRRGSRTGSRSTTSSGVGAGADRKAGSSSTMTKIDQAFLAKCARHGIQWSIREAAW